MDPSTKGTLFVEGVFGGFLLGLGVGGGGGGVCFFWGCGVGVWGWVVFGVFFLFGCSTLLLDKKCLTAGKRIGFRVGRRGKFEQAQRKPKLRRKPAGSSKRTKGGS